MTESIKAPAQRIRQPKSNDGGGVSNRERQDLLGAFANFEPADGAGAIRDLRAAEDPIADDLAALDRLFNFGAEDISTLLGTARRAITGSAS